MKENTTLFLVVFLLLLAFFSSDFRYTGKAVDASTTVTSASCRWTDEQFEVCATVNWHGEDGWYVKPILGGGGGLSKASIFTEKTFTYCEYIGTREGKKPVNLYVYDARDRLQQKIFGTEVSCVRPTKQLTKRAYVLVTQNKGRSRGEGTETFKFAQEVQSCVLTGTYTLKDPPPLRGSHYYCDDASGIFSAYIDEHTQHTTDDRGFFPWRGLSRGKINPPSETTTGYVMHTKLCDSVGRDQYSVKATGELRGDLLTIDWEYHDDDTEKPNVEYVFDINCEPKAQPVRTSPRITTPTVEFPTQQKILEQPTIIEPEPFVQDIEIQPQTPLDRIRQWLRNIFF